MQFTSLQLSAHAQSVSSLLSFKGFLVSTKDRSSICVLTLSSFTFSRTLLLPLFLLLCLSFFSIYWFPSIEKQANLSWLLYQWHLLSSFASSTFSASTLNRDCPGLCLYPLHCPHYLLSLISSSPMALNSTNMSMMPKFTSLTSTLSSTSHLYPSLDLTYLHGWLIGSQKRTSDFCIFPAQNYSSLHLNHLSKWLYFPTR